jgi:hypothetical protein
MRKLLATRRSRRRCSYTQRWQAETVNSMMKRNLGSALRGKTSVSRQRDLALKVLVHNLMILRRSTRVETEQAAMKKPFVCCALMLLVAGCAGPNVDVTKTSKGYLAPTNPNVVDILETKPDRPFTELGSMIVSGWPPGDVAKMHNELRAKAAPLGADAVIILNSGVAIDPSWGDTVMWATAVAIKYK